MIRLVKGKLIGGDYGMRVSVPGTDAFSAPYGDPGVPFDTRYSDIGTVIAAGLIQCGGGQIPFPGGDIGYVPVARIMPWTGVLSFPKQFVNGSTGDDSSQRSWIKEIAIVRSSSIEVVPYTNPFYNTQAYTPVTGAYYFYAVFSG